MINGIQNDIKYIIHCDYKTSGIIKNIQLKNIENIGSYSRSLLYHNK